MAKFKAKDSLFVLLLLTAVVIIFPPLGRVPLQPDEIVLSTLAEKFAKLGIGSVFTDTSADFLSNFYAYIVSVCHNNLDISDTLAVRLPSAVIILLLTLGLYQFCDRRDKLSHSFLAALLFISSYLVSSLAYRASTVSLIALPFIFSLSAVYHWTKSPNLNKTYLLIITTLFTSIFMGILGPVAVWIMGIILLLMQQSRKIWQYLRLTANIAAGTVAAYVMIVFITNDTTIATSILGVEQVTESLSEYSKLEIFIRHIVFSIFPWSIPIIIGLFWITANPSWIRRQFLSLNFFRQFGVILFLLAIPTFFAFNRLSLVMLLVAIFFNMSVISSFILSQIHNHTISWRITGSLFGLLIAIFAGMFVALHFGVSIEMFGYRMPPFADWSVWSILLLASIAVSLYTLSRNQRTIHLNNRYLYNIVILYILAQLLYKGFVNPYLIAL